ncbi:MAG: alpha-hydroxy acid oxidase [Thermoplasmata archaeon]
MPDPPGSTPDVPGEFSCLSDLEPCAAKRLPPSLWDYVQGGSGEGRTLRANREMFQRATLRPTALAGLRQIDLTTKLLGAPVRLPIFLAPTAYQGLIHPEGEPATARAAQRAGILAVFSTLSSFSLEDIARASADGRRWFQLYLQPEFARTRLLVERAERAGYTAIVLTVDAPVLGIRDGQLRSGFAMDALTPVGNGPGLIPPSRGPTPAGDIWQLRSDSQADWSIVAELRRITPLPIVIKGVLTAGDARRAVEAGAVAIVVSNHGGRQLDGVPATLSVLPEILRAVEGRAEVYLDGGVRRGSDVVIALALGARAVGIGRPVLWALAAGGQAGVERWLSLLASDLATAMLLTGCGDLSQLDPSMVDAPR